MLSQSVLHFLFTLLVGEDDEGLGLDEGVAIGHSHYNTLYHTLVLPESLLDLMRADPYAPDLEHTIGTSVVEEVAGCILDVNISSLKPLARHCLLRQLMLAPVQGTDRIAFYHKHARLAGGYILSFLI